MTLGGDDMTEEWRTGDKVRNKETGEIVTVHEFKPSGYIRHDQGFTYRRDKRRGWGFINEYELVERADNVTKKNVGIIKMTLSDGSVIEGTAEEIAKLQRLVSEGEPVSNEYEVGPKTFPKPAQIGDRIKIVDAFFANVDEGDYDNEDVMTVIEIDNDGDVVKTDKHDGVILSREFEIIGRGELGEREMSFLRAGREVGEVKAGDIISTKFYGLLEVIDFSEKAIHPVSVTINGVEDGLQVEACTLVCPVEKRTDLA